MGRNNPKNIKAHNDKLHKEQDKEKVLVMVNLRNRAVDYTLPAALANSNWTNGLSSGNVALTNKVTLQPYAYLVLKNQ